MSVKEVSPEPQVTAPPSPSPTNDFPTLHLQNVPRPQQPISYRGTLITRHHFQAVCCAVFFARPPPLHQEPLRKPIHFPAAARTSSSPSSCNRTNPGGGERTLALRSAPQPLGGRKLAAAERIAQNKNKTEPLLSGRSGLDIFAVCSCTWAQGVPLSSHSSQ